MVNDDDFDTQLPLPGLNIPDAMNVVGSFADPVDVGCVDCQPHGFERSRYGRVFFRPYGRTPLRAAWDTNVLLDFLHHGRRLWDGTELEVPEGEYRDELEGLGVLLQYWIWRDIRWYVFDSQLADAKKRLTPGRRHAREHALDRLALILAELEPEGELDGACSRCQRRPLTRRPSRRLPEWARTIIEGAGADRLDRQRIIDAVRGYADVLLTRDNRLLSRGRAGTFAALGLNVLSPLDLVVELMAVDGPPWPALLGGPGEGPTAPLMQDMHKMTHLIEALPPDEGA